MELDRNEASGSGPSSSSKHDHGYGDILILEDLPGRNRGEAASPCMREDGLSIVHRVCGMVSLKMYMRDTRAPEVRRGAEAAS
jgi:hypothetical protein